MKPPASPCASFSELNWLGKSNALGLCAAMLGLSALLWPTWRHDENLAHGVFLPLFSAILLVESRRGPNPRFLLAGAGSLAACLFLVFASLASLALAFVYATALGWSHAMAESLLASSLVLALGAAWLSFADKRVGFFPLNWSATVAIVLWLFAGPPPPGTYARLSSFLQSEVTHGVVGILGALGIAAYQAGNVIELARTSVGVSEACSGVRSLISCTVAGLFLSALLVRMPWHRALVAVLSPAIGLAMNFLRSLLLTLLANGGVSIEGRWHDLTGASIIVCTTVLVAAFSLWLHGREPPAGAEQAVTAGRPLGVSPLMGVVGAGLFLAATSISLLSFRAAPAVPEQASIPDLASLMPPPPTGWTASMTSDLDQFSGILHTHTLIERVYSAGPTLESAHVTLYLAYWKPGEAPVSLVDAHSPDACWPGSGWEAQPVPHEREVLEVGGGYSPQRKAGSFPSTGSRHMSGSGTCLGDARWLMSTHIPQQGSSKLLGIMVSEDPRISCSFGFRATGHGRKLLPSRSCGNFLRA